MEKLKAIIIDDESLSRKMLDDLLQDFCSSWVEVIGKVDGAEEARDLIRKKQPDVLFLDIKMPSESGFDLLNSIEDQNFDVVFVTAYDEFALKAIKASAVDYLLKPVDVDELEKAIRKIVRKRERQQHTPLGKNRWNSLIKNLSGPSSTIQQLVLPHRKGFRVVELNDIIRLEAQSNYTIIQCKNGKENLKVADSLKKFEEILPEARFFRIHKSHIINIDFLEEYVNRKGSSYVVLTNGEQLTVAVRRKSSFVLKVKELSSNIDIT